MEERDAIAGERRDAAGYRVPEPTLGDDRDWSFTATERCGECGYDPADVTDAQLAGALRGTVVWWREALRQERYRERPEPRVWSPLEYACHVRDVHLLFADRVALMLAADDPQFAGWDQDVAAVEGRYWAQDPERVADELAAAAEVAAGRYDEVPDDAWGRTGRRSSGGVFTISTMGHYHLHDVIHHLVDVRGGRWPFAG